MSPPSAAAPTARSASATPAIIILGADALIAVRPATPGQLTNACYAAGYSAVIPASWGDELVASGCLTEIAARGQESVVLCSCPRVAERVRRVGNLAPHLLNMASPPVLAARYLRARAGATGVHITYVGACPGATDPAIDRHATPAALLRSLTKRGIVPLEQSSDVDERLSRDARRFYSLPGGAPAPNWLYAEKRGYTLIEPTARDFLAEVAFRISEKERRVIDLAPRLGCACSGALVGEPWTAARDAVTAMEPPRAVHEVLDHDVPLEMGVPLEPWLGSASEGEPTLPLPLTELAALHDPETKAAAVRRAPPPPVSRPSRPAARAAGEPPTGARRAPAGVSPGAPPGAPPAPGKPRRASGPGKRTKSQPARPAEHRTHPRPASPTPARVSALPPVPPMPAHIAAKVGGIAARVAPTAAPIASAAVASAPVASAPPASTPAASASVASAPIARAHAATPSVAPTAIAPTAIAAAAAAFAPIVPAPPAAVSVARAAVTPAVAVPAIGTPPRAAAVAAVPTPPAVVEPAATAAAPSAPPTSVPHALPSIAPTVLAGPAILPPLAIPPASGAPSRAAAADTGSPGAAAPAATPRKIVDPPMPARSPFATPLASQMVPMAPRRQPRPLASHLDLPSEAAAAEAVTPSAPGALGGGAPAAAESATTASELEGISDDPADAGPLNVEPHNSAALHKVPAPLHVPNTRTRLYMIAAASVVLVVVSASLVMLRIMPSSRGAKHDAAGAPVPIAAPAATAAATPASANGPQAPKPDTLASGAVVTSTTDTVAMPGMAPMVRLPIGPAATPAAYPRRPGSARGRDSANANAQFRSNPATVYTKGAAPIPRNEAALKSAAEVRASAAFRDALTPEAAAQMAEVRSQVAARQHRVDSLKHAADSVAAR